MSETCSRIPDAASQERRVARSDRIMLRLSSGKGIDRPRRQGRGHALMRLAIAYTPQAWRFRPTLEKKARVVAGRAFSRSVDPELL
jgi:hypothetical protein